MKIKVGTLRRMIQEKLMEAIRKPAKPLPVVSSKLAGRHQFRFGSGGLYTGEVMISFTRQNHNSPYWAILNVFIDHETMESSEVETDLHAIDNLNTAIEHLVGFQIHWIDRSFTGYLSNRTRDSIMQRTAGSSGPLEIRWEDDQDGS